MIKNLLHSIKSTNVLYNVIFYNIYLVKKRCFSLYFIDKEFYTLYNNKAMNVLGGVKYEKNISTK